MKYSVKAFLAAALAIAISGCVTAKPLSVDRSKSRTIPLSLYTGLSEGETKAVHHLIHKNYPQNTNPAFVEGPIEWTAPNGSKHAAYTRKRDYGPGGGLVEQIYKVRDDKQAYGIIWDSRWKSFTENAAKFPLGTWYQGEQRTFTTGGGAMTIIIEDIGLETGDLVSLWKAYNRCWRYKHSPGKGMVEIDENC